ncbi:5-carboxymethyl-2-hydroxymuconate isomerase [Aspergillus ellipticus CBS 707.79]|uniref:5-carboxymethyl-2-hydroxymuconate isomerase n=1 Tax=Aspergillus ellipticus CBS 707.79 TaxID=1448320 RepID=A0A319CTR2_9EURO|nr:5-carboxymethyl-2-hydroxymuconate isomerase [Aspergillus ellipticus CBS 707.79]
MVYPLETTVPYINWTSKHGVTQHSPTRSQADWGKSLSLRKLAPYENVRFDPKLQPRSYRIAGTSPESKILLLNVQISLDSTGKDPYPGDVYIKGERIQHVGTVPGIEAPQNDPSVRVIQGAGRNLMSGLGDAHTHLTWTETSLENMGNIGVEEHTLATARSAMMYLDSGYTLCFGAASAKNRLDSVVREAINNGTVPGLRYLANAKEIARRNGELVAAITAFADVRLFRPLEMREVIRHHASLGVAWILENRSATDCYFTDEETAACVDEAHRLGLRVCSHARSRDSIAQRVKHGVDVIYHGSYIDDETMNELEKNKHRHVVAPAINWLYATVYDAGPFGYSFDQAEQSGYKKELEVTMKACQEMHQRGITVLPGGDYGFAWTPHGTYARDLEHFVKLLNFTPMESILAATAGVASLFMQAHELGKIQPGYYADCILVDGNPLEDISVLQNHEKLHVIMINEETIRNFVNYLDERNRFRVGHLNFASSHITPLAMISGAPITSLCQIIELLNAVVPHGDPVPLDSVQVQAPFPDREVLVVSQREQVNGNHEFSVKRYTSIISCGEDVHQPAEASHLRCNGAMGVVISKSDLNIAEFDAMSYVWGYTIVNAFSTETPRNARKPTLFGEYSDTPCSIGPIAIPAAHLPTGARLQAFTNNKKHQDITLVELTRLVPPILKSLSASKTLHPGDVFAISPWAAPTNNQQSSTTLRAGDHIEISITGLGSLHNTIQPASKHAAVQHTSLSRHLADLNLERTPHSSGSTRIGDKLINLQKFGQGPKIAILIHGLGGTGEYLTPLIKNPTFPSQYTSYVYDLEGHGLTAMKIASPVTVATYTDDLTGIISHIAASNPVTLICHSLGCLIAMTYALRNPTQVNRLILMGPPSTPLPSPAQAALLHRAAAVRDNGLLGSGVVNAVSDAGTSTATKTSNPLAYAAVRSSLLAQIPEGYAKGCMALAGAQELEIERLHLPCLVIAGDEDRVAPVDAAKAIHRRIPNSRMEILPATGHWHVLESPNAVAGIVGREL